MQPLLRIPLTKFAAVTAALACAGGGVFIGRSSGATAAPAATLDHYLCVGHRHAQCAPVGVTLPDGTTIGVSDPLDRLVCDPPPRPRHMPPTSPASVTVTNELSPTGSAGPTPVPLVTGSLRWICTLTPSGTFPQSRPRAAAVALTTYACNWVHYPSADSARFSQPFSATVDGLRLRVGDPSRLCVPTAPAPADGANNSLLCFHLRFDRRHFEGWVRLCVPSTVGGMPGSGSTTTSTGTAGTAPSTTAASSTTTTAPKTSPPTTASTTTTTTTTTRPPTTTTTAPPTTTTGSTTTTTRPQPCPGILVNGVCIINV